MDTFSADTEPLVDFEAAMHAAQQASGLDDFGDQAFVARAKQWLQIAAAESIVGQQGRAGLSTLIAGWLVNRLRFVNDVKRHPEILDEQVREPIFITGMPRTGTTKLHRMMSCDPELQSLPFWLALNLAPFPEADPTEPDPRIAIASGYLDAIKSQYPEFMAGHPAFIDEPEEEIYWLETDFQSLTNCLRVRAHSYLRSIMNSPTFESHAFLKRALQYVQWQRGSSGQRVWVLKSPCHLGNLPSLFDIFPDATVVHTYRDPAVALASTCRMFELFRSLTVDVIDRSELGEEQLEYWTAMQSRYLAIRDDSRYRDRIVDVHYNDICDDVFTPIRNIYKHRGKNLASTTERLMRTHEERHPQHQLGQHKYTLEQYGLTLDAVNSACRNYVRRYTRSGAEA